MIIRPLAIPRLAYRRVYAAVQDFFAPIGMKASAPPPRRPPPRKSPPPPTTVDCTNVVSGGLVLLRPHLFSPSPHPPAISPSMDFSIEAGTRLPKSLQSRRDRDAEKQREYAEELEMLMDQCTITVETEPVPTFDGEEES